MPNSLPSGAVPANLPADIRPQIVSSCARPPDGDGWLHEIKHDGHRLVAIIPGRGSLKLLSRNGYDRTFLFGGPFRQLASSGRPIILDGEIAVPDERGVTHIDLLQAVSRRYGADRLAYFAFDVLYLDGHDLRRCPIEERKALLQEVLEEIGCDRIVYVDHIIGRSAGLFEQVRDIGAEGIVSKRLGSMYRGRESRDWLKTKCHEFGEFVITGFEELGEGRLEAVYVAEENAGTLKPAGQIRFGFAGKGLWSERWTRCAPDRRGKGWCRLLRRYRQKSNSSGGTNAASSVTASSWPYTLELPRGDPCDVMTCYGHATAMR